MSDVCPNKETLQKYAASILPDTDSQQLESHLDECTACEALVANLERSSHHGIRVALQSASRPTSSKSHLAAIDENTEIGDCRLLKEIGSGAFARVFLALQRSMQRFIAIKISYRASSEPKLLSKLNHPHIVRVYHYDDRRLAHRGLYQLYMEYVPGCSLKQLLDDIRSVDPPQRTGGFVIERIKRLRSGSGDMSIDEGTPSSFTQTTWEEAVCWIGARLADALDYAHQNGVIHRDIKPDNILLRANGSPMLLDLNVGFGRETGVRPGDDFGGSLPYMSPEQRYAFKYSKKSTDVSEASDVYSLAVVIYELLTGHLPNENRTVIAGATVTLNATAHDEADTADLNTTRAYPYDCAEELKSVIEGSLSIEPSERPTTAELARRLAILSTPPLRKLLVPPKNHWTNRLATWPVLGTALAAFVPNLIIAGLNVLYNRLPMNEIKVSQFEPEVNAVVFPMGFLLLVPYLLWVVRATGDEQRLEQPNQWNTYATRCLLMGRFFAMVVFSLWAFTGVAFPYLCDVHGGQNLGAYDYVQFFLTQILFGVFASSITFFCVTVVSVAALFPQSLWKERPPKTKGILSRLDWHVGFYRTLLALAPSFALIAISVFDRNDPYLLLQLGLFGAIGYGLAISLTPIIRSAFLSTTKGLMSTKQILYGDGIDRDQTS